MHISKMFSVLAPSVTLSITIVHKDSKVINISLITPSPHKNKTKQNKKQRQQNPTSDRLSLPLPKLQALHRSVPYTHQKLPKLQPTRNNEISHWAKKPLSTS